MFSQEVQDALQRPIDPSRVKEREGGRGMRLSYIEAHDAVATANAIFGYGNWGYNVISLDLINEEPVERNDRKGFRVGYRAIVNVHVEETSFSDVGYGDAVEYTGSSITPHELASKEAVSDALKRALKNFGEQFGLSLYSAEGRADIERRAALERMTDAQLKQKLFALGKAQLGTDSPTAAQLAKHFSVAQAKLSDRDTILTILAAEA